MAKMGRVADANGKDLLVDYLLGAELLVLLVLHIAQQEDEVAALDEHV